MMTRRGLLGLFGGLGAGAVLDAERLLWIPGAKLISIPNAIPRSLPESLVGLIGMDDYWTEFLLPSIDKIIMRGYRAR